MKKLVLVILLAALRPVYRLLKLLPVRDKITMISRQSDEITPDFAVLLRRGPALFPGYDIRVLTKRLRPTAAGLLGYGFHMISQVFHIATSRVVLLDSYCIAISNLRHRKELVVIQMWHAMGLMKNAGVNAVGMEEGRDPALAKQLHMHEGYDFIFASSAVCRKPIARLFGCDVDKTVVLPLPVVDQLRDEAVKAETKARIAARYGLDPRKKTILYAPTFRKSELVLQQKLDELTAAVDFERYQLFVKPHALSEIRPRDDRVIVDRAYSSIEIAMACDYVITDYSSVIYEVLILGKPLFFYAFDIDEYIRNRGFFIDYEKEIPGRLYGTGEALLSAIEEEDWNAMEQQAFLHRYVDLPAGSVAVAIADFIRAHI